MVKKWTKVNNQEMNRAVTGHGIPQRRQNLAGRRGPSKKPKENTIRKRKTDRGEK